MPQRRPDGDDASTGAAGMSRARLIARAAERTHEARNAYIEAANSLEGGAEAVFAAELHNAVLDYFYALRPMKDEPAVKNFWQSVTLWTAEQPRPTPDEPQNTETVEVTGFDRLSEEAVKKRRVTEEKNGLQGKRTVTREVPVRLPPEILLRVSAKLDSAAGKLGFAPDTEDSVIDTILEEEPDKTQPETRGESP